MHFVDVKGCFVFLEVYLNTKFYLFHGPSANKIAVWIDVLDLNSPAEDLGI